MEVYTERMHNRYEQVCRISTEEMENRVEQIRNLMKEKGYDVFLLLDGTWEGYSHWLTGSGLISDVVIYQTGKSEAIWERSPSALMWEDLRLKHFCYEDSLDLSRIRKRLASGGKIRFGIARLEAMSEQLYQCLLDIFPGIEMEDCTQSVDVMKAVKSEQELKCIADTNRLLQKVMETMPEIIQPGKTIRQINNETREYAEELGSGGEKSLFYAMQYGKDDGSPLTFAEGIGNPEDRISGGDRLFMMLEGNGPGGLFSAIGRYFILGEPCEQTVRYWDMAVKAQEFAASMMKPGTCLRDIFDANYEYIASEGFLTNHQNYLHSFGYVYGERPYLHDRSETEILRKGMHYIVHPHIVVERGNETGKAPCDEYFSVDTYYVSDEGGIRANSFPEKLIIL